MDERLDRSRMYSWSPPTILRFLRGRGNGLHGLRSPVEPACAGGKRETKGERVFMRACERERAMVAEMKVSVTMNQASLHGCPCRFWYHILVLRNWNGSPAGHHVCGIVADLSTVDLAANGKINFPFEALSSEIALDFKSKDICVYRSWIDYCSTLFLAIMTVKFLAYTYICKCFIAKL